MADITSTSFTELSYIAEVTPGTTPTSPPPAFQILPIVSGGPQGNTDVVSSEVLRSDRQIDDVVAVDQNIDGSVTYELSYAPYKPLLQALLQAPAPTAFSETQTDIAMDANTVAGEYKLTSLALADFSALAVDEFVKISGTSTITNGNGIFRVKAASTLVLTLYDDDGNVSGTEALSASIVIAGENMRSGVAAPTSYTFLKKITGIATDAFMYYKGCQISSMSLNFETASILGGEFSIVGLSETNTETELVGSTYTNIPAYTLMNSVNNLTVKAPALGAGGEFQSLSLTIDNNINAAKAIGTFGSLDLASFTLSVEGDVTLYFQDLSAFTTFNNSLPFTLELRANDSSGNTIIFYMPKAKFLTLEAPIDGKDNFLAINGSLKALRSDGAAGFTLQISHIAA